jgi:hypothetical protein
MGVHGNDIHTAFHQCHARSFPSFRAQGRLMFYYTSERSFNCIYFNQIQVTLTFKLDLIQEVLLHSQDFDNDDE